MPRERNVAGLVLSTGEVFRAADHGRGMPKKQPGVHRWVAMVSYFMSPGQARAATIPGNRVVMDGSNLLSFGIGCWDCEQVYEAAVNTSCPAGDEWS